MLGWRYTVLPSASCTLGKYTNPPTAPTPAVVPRSATNAAIALACTFSVSVILFTSAVPPDATSFTIPPMAPPFWSVSEPIGAPEFHTPPVVTPSNCSSANCDSDVTVRSWIPSLLMSGTKFDCVDTLRPDQSTPMPNVPQGELDPVFQPLLFRPAPPLVPLFWTRTSMLCQPAVSVVVPKPVQAAA